MPDVTIISHVAQACQVTFDEPNLAIGWLKMLLGIWTPNQFLFMAKSIADDADHFTNIMQMTFACMGTPA
jgi:hypothetical protein